MSYLKGLIKSPRRFLVHLQCTNSATLTESDAILSLTFLLLKELASLPIFPELYIARSGFSFGLKYLRYDMIYFRDAISLLGQLSEMIPCDIFVIVQDLVYDRSSSEFKKYFERLQDLVDAFLLRQNDPLYNPQNSRPHRVRRFLLLNKDMGPSVDHFKAFDGGLYYDMKTNLHKTRQFLELLSGKA